MNEFLIALLLILFFILLGIGTKFILIAKKIKEHNDKTSIIILENNMEKNRKKYLDY